MTWRQVLDPGIHFFNFRKEKLITQVPGTLRYYGRGSCAILSRRLAGVTVRQ